MEIDLLWRNIKSNIRETTLSKWLDQDCDNNAHEKFILRDLNLLFPSSSPYCLRKIPCNNSFSLWTLPPLDFLELNFDGVSKGNPILVGLGGIFFH
jgi:hypothetical protein